MAYAEKAEVALIKAAGVVLELTNEEAQTLADLMCMIGGDSYRSRRKHADAIANALEDAGVYWNASPFRDNGVWKDIVGRLTLL